MNTKLFTIVAMVALVAPAYATVEKDTVQLPPGTEICQQYGFDYSVAVYTYDDGTYHQDYELGGYSTAVAGSNEHAYWTSEPGVAGVISREGTDTYLHEGGTEGDFAKHARSNIKRVVLCGNDNEVPEFGTLAAGVAIAGALAGLVAFRKRN